MIFGTSISSLLKGDYMCTCLACFFTVGDDV